MGKNTLVKHLGPWGRGIITPKEPSPIQVHSQLNGHQLSQDNFNIIGR